MTDRHPIALAHVAAPGARDARGSLELFADTDPAAPIEPGQEIELSLTVTPAEGAYRTYGYLVGDFLTPVATVVRHPGLSLLSNGRFATYVQDTGPRTVTCVLRVDPLATEGAVLLPRVVVGLMPEPGDRLISSAAVSDAGFRVRRHWLPGQCVTLRPGGHAVLPAGYSPVPGLRLKGVGVARHGVLTCASDGAVIYEADPEHLGYDRFEVVFENEDGRRVWSDVTVFIGDLGRSPGVLAMHG